MRVSSLLSMALVLIPGQCGLIASAGHSQKQRLHGHRHVQPPLEHNALSMASSQLREAKPVRYGPGDCVSTWKNKQSRCMMQTNCTEDQIKDYDFYIICVDGGGQMVKHSFGKGSFDPSERFDTLITCAECGSHVKVQPAGKAPANLTDLGAKKNERRLGAEGDNKMAVANMSVEEAVHELVADVKELRNEIKNATSAVDVLSVKVFSSQAAAPKKSLLRRASIVQRDDESGVLQEDSQDVEEDAQDTSDDAAQGQFVEHDQVEQQGTDTDENANDIKALNTATDIERREYIGKDDEKSDGTEDDSDDKVVPPDESANIEDGAQAEGRDIDGYDSHTNGDGSEDAVEEEPKLEESKSQ